MFPEVLRLLLRIKHRVLESDDAELVEDVVELVDEAVDKCNPPVIGMHGKVVTRQDRRQQQ